MRISAWFLRGFAALAFAGAVFTTGFLFAAGEDAPHGTPNAWTADATGWEDILPPPDLKGWFRVPIPATAHLGRTQWHVENGTLVCDGDGGHDMLLLDRKLRNCIFHVEFRFTKIEGKKGYNSGVFIRTSRDGAIWHQAQIGSLDGGYWFGATPDGVAAKRFDVPTKPSSVKEAGECNTFELTTRDRNLALWVNGVAANPLPDCGQAEGYIGLEAEGYLITFRNLKLKILP